MSDDLLAELGIDPGVLTERGLARCDEARELALAETGGDGREHRLVPDAAQAWRRMKAAAAADGVPLEIVSAFRSIERQAEIIRSKLKAGQSLATILTVSAVPGYSEHHTGRAVDLTTPGFAALEEEFEMSPAFAWLSRHAGQFGFRLSYPRDNPYGYCYEPWHWCFHGDS